ncbi:MAG TPA: carbohydrate kinase family protein [Pyrinomonadaceae bacterium]|nr:carbohydrate kinase family protein [Pyrinomonadaceae bacterium]
MSDLKKKIAVIGELNVDLVASGLVKEPTLGQEILAQDFTMTLGSASAVFACGIAKLGNQISFISRIGKDDFGRFCLDELQKKDVSTEKVEVIEKVKTGVTIVLSMPKDRAMVTYLGAISELSLADIPLDNLNNHNHLHLTSYFLQTKLQPDFPLLMQEAKKRGLTVSFDPNSDPSQSWNEQIFEVIRNADIFFINELEATQLTGKNDLEAMLRDLEKYCPCVVIKLGAKGAIAISNGKIVQTEGFKVDAIDTTGAGDTFAAGFVHAYLEKKELSECLKIGNACGALSTLKVGGTSTQPDLQQLNEFLNQ